MKKNSSNPCIVVGYDGSSSAEAAVEYAVARAGPRGKTVVVHAVQPRSEAIGYSPGDPVRAERHEHGQAVLDALVMEHGHVLLDHDFETELLEGEPADVIARVAEVRSADEIVVGSRGFGRARALLGSVSHDLVHRADRPLVIVPARASGR